MYNFEIYPNGNRGEKPIIYSGEKSSFDIIVKKGAAEPEKMTVSGYALTVRAPSGDLLRLGLDRRGSCWCLSELVTGYAVTGAGIGYGRTRAEALRGIDRAFLDRVARIVRGWTGAVANQDAVREV